MHPSIHPPTHLSILLSSIYLPIHYLSILGMDYSWISFFSKVYNSLLSLLSLSRILIFQILAWTSNFPIFSLLFFTFGLFILLSGTVFQLCLQILILAVFNFSYHIFNFRELFLVSDCFHFLDAVYTLWPFRTLLNLFSAPCIVSISFLWVFFFSDYWKQIIIWVF